MKKLILLGLITVFSTAFLSACNTLGGFGQDLSETGKAIGEAAGWTQEQINDTNASVQDSDSEADSASSTAPSTNLGDDYE